MTEREPLQTTQEIDDRAILVAMTMPDSSRGEIDEFKELVLSAGVLPLVIVTGKRETPQSKYFVGRGKADEIAEAVKLYEANVILVNHDLSPSQSRNLENLCQCRVVDRTELILDIFAQRAQTFEGKLQVELAQLTRLSTQLIRRTSNLDQLRGGAVGLRGPGETQLEQDRRVIGIRIRQLKKRLETVDKMRAQGRTARRRNEVPTLALVGYTNAGKSSLFNRLTDASVFAEDKLFATLDPTHRSIELPSIGRIVFVDTVGFISKLPHDLVEAFRSTLQVAVEADLLLEVIDVVDEERELKMDEVDKVLEEIGADLVPRLQVFNKIDLDKKLKPQVKKYHLDDCTQNGHPQDDLAQDGLIQRGVTQVWLSAQSGEGVALLLDEITAFLQKAYIKITVLLPTKEGRLRALFYEENAVEDEMFTEKGESILSLHTSQPIFERISKAYPQLDSYVIKRP